MTHNKGFYAGVVASLSLIVISISFQNCAKVLFQKNPPQQFSYMLESQIEQKKGLPLNLVLLIDGSNSMSPLKESFKKKVADFLVSISRFNVTINLSSINDLAGSYLTSYSINGVSQTGPYDLIKLQALPVGTSLEFHYQNTYLNSNNLNIQRGTLPGKEIVFQSDMTEADRQKNLLNMQNRIESMFTKGASNDVGNDQTFCQILSDLDEITSHPEKFPTQSATIFMVLSNEDDESSFPSSTGTSKVLSPSSCVKTLKNSATVVQAKTQNYISLNTCMAQIKVKALIDGSLGDASVTMPINFPYDPNRKENVSSCDDILNQSTYKQKITSQLTAQYPGLQSYTLVSSVVKYTEAYDFSGTLTCAQLSAQYQTGLVVPNSCKSSAGNHGITGMDSFFTESIHVPMNSTEYINNDLSLAILNKLKTSSGISEQFYFSFLINPPSGECNPLSNGARVGEKYQQLAKELGSQAELTPLCDLSKVGMSILRNASDYIDRFYLNKVKMPVANLNMIDHIEVIRSDSSISYPTPSDYKQEGPLLVFQVGYLNVGDQVKIILKSDD